MFYAVQALLTRKKLTASKHSGAIAIFNRKFVKKISLTENFPGTPIFPSFDIYKEFSQIV